MPSSIIQAYQGAYYLGATHRFFNRFQLVRAAATFVYTGVGSGAVGATSGQLAVGQLGSQQQIHYLTPALNSASLTLQIEGRANMAATFTKLKRISITAKNATWYLATIIPERMDWLRVGVRAASPAASDIISIYGLFR